MSSSRRVPPADRAPASPLRVAVERRSAVALVALSRGPKWLLPVVTVALLAGALLLPTVPALVCLVLVLALVGWLTFLSWPAVPTTARVLRVVSLLMLLTVGVSAVQR